MEENFTYNDMRTIGEMLDDYNTLQVQVEEKNLAEISTSEDYESLSLDDKQLLDEYTDNRDFLVRVRDSLDFAHASTMVREVEGDGEVERQCVSLYENKFDYANSMLLLTAGFDSEMSDAIKSVRDESFESSLMDYRTYKSLTQAAKFEPEIQETMSQIVGDNVVKDDFSVADLLEAVENTENVMAVNEINKDRLIDSTIEVNMDNEENGTLNVITSRILAYEKDYENEKSEKEAEPVEVVESNDGYVMAATERTEENAYKFDEIVREEGGSASEVKHNGVPLETTTDASRVGGKIRLEEADDIGTIEYEENVPSYEDKAVMEEYRKYDEEQQDIQEEAETTEIKKKSRTDKEYDER
jgi:hypothetical protein